MAHIQEPTLIDPQPCNTRQPAAASSSSSSPGPRKVLVLVNPISGTGIGLKVFKRQVAPFLRANQIHHELQVTRLEPSVRHFFRDLPLADLKQFSAILVVSGDGTIHQLLNGLMSRPDADQALSIPLSVYPCGSGNGLVHSLNYLTAPTKHKSAHQHQQPTQLNLNNNQTTDCDLVKITYGPNQTIWSFLSIGWGLIADIDIESEEKLRFLGHQRFHFYSIYKAIRRKFYKGRLSYKKVTLHNTSTSDATTSSSHQQQQPTDEEWVRHEGEFACIYAVYLPYISKSVRISPKSTLSDQLIYLLYVTEHLTFLQVIRLLDSLTRGLQHKLPFANVVPVREFEFQPLEPSKVVVDGELIPWVPEHGPIRAEIASNKMKLTSIIPLRP